MRFQRPSLYESRKRITSVDGGEADPKKKQEQGIVFMLMQYETFGMFGDASVEEVANYLKVGTQAARKHLRALEDKGVAVKVNKRKPVTFGLTQQFKEEFGVEPVVWRNPFE